MKENRNPVFWLDPVYYHGDFSRPKYALYKKYINEDGDEVEEQVLWGFWEEIPGYDSEDANPDDIDNALNAMIRKKLGFVPEYVVG